MDLEKKNLVLIGMPTSGKTTIGKRLNELYDINFIDTYHLIINKYKKGLKEICDKGENEFKKIEEDLKKQEQDLVSKKNVISEDEFKLKLENLKKEIGEYKAKRQNIIQDSTQRRIQASAHFSNQIKPILGDYAAKNNISIIVQKKNIIMGKKELDITSDILKIVEITL